MKSPWLPVLCCFLLPASVRSQPNKKMVVPLEGSQAFCNILHGFALKPIKSLEELAEKKPAETLLIVFGDTRILDDLRKHIGSLEKFRSKGGAVLIASDRDDQGRLLEWRLRISGEVVSEKIGTPSLNTEPSFPTGSSGRPSDEKPTAWLACVWITEWMSGRARSTSECMKTSL